MMKINSVNLYKNNLYFNSRSNRNQNTSDKATVPTIFDLGDNTPSCGAYNYYFVAKKTKQENMAQLIIKEISKELFDLVKQRTSLLFESELLLYHNLTNTLESDFKELIQENPDNEFLKGMMDYFINKKPVSSLNVMFPYETVNGFSDKYKMYDFLEKVTMELISGENSNYVLDRGEDISYYEYLNLSALLVYAQSSENKEVRQYARRCYDILQDKISLTNNAVVEESVNEFVKNKSSIYKLEKNTDKFMQLVGASNSSSYALYGFCKGIKDSKKDKLTIDEIKKAYNLIKDFDDATNNLYEFLGLNPRCNLQLIADKSTAQDMLEEMKEALLTVGI